LRRHRIMVFMHSMFQLSILFALRRMSSPLRPPSLKETFNPLCIETQDYGTPTLELIELFQSSLHWDYIWQGESSCNSKTFQSSLHWDKRPILRPAGPRHTFQSSLHWDYHSAPTQTEYVPTFNPLCIETQLSGS